MKETRYFIAEDEPWQKFLAQIKQESRCDEGVTAFDGGMSLAQFMPETAEWINKREKALHEFPYNPYDPRWSIRALILYDKYLYGIVACKDWYFAFRAYNGGAGLLNREITRAASCETALVESQCKRKIIKLKSGPLDLCKVNCTYPRRIAKYAEAY